MKKLIVLTVYLIIISFLCCGQGVISFTFDDGYKGVIDIALPLMNEHGFTGTAYIVIDRVGEKGYIDITDISVLRDHEWEIGSHTCEHPNLVAASLFSMDYVHKELSVSQSLLNATTFASPHGAYNQSVNEAIEKYYRAHRTTDMGMNNRIDFDPYKLKSILPLARTSVLELEAWVDKAIDEDAWLIFTFHSFNPGRPEGVLDSLWNYDREKFERLLDYISKKGVEVYTIKEVILN